MLEVDDCYRSRAEQGGQGVVSNAILNRVVKTGIIKKVAHEQKLRGEGVSHVDAWENAFQAERKASAKVLR